MFAIIGSLLGFGTSFAPKILETINKKKDHTHELDKMQAPAEI